MFLQVTGRLDPGETYATVDLDAGSILPRGTYVTLELVNVIICKQEDHDHFPKASVSAYPDDPSRYPETITVRQPRPRPLTFRRRTRLHVPELELPVRDNDDEYVEYESDRRFRREATEGEELGDMEFMYAASFREPIFEFEIDNFPGLSLEGLVNGVLQGRQSPASFSHFQRLLKHHLVYELVDPSTSGEEKRGRSKRVKITLPPSTQLMCGRRDFFAYLGMYDLVEKMGETELFGLKNDSLTDSKIFLSTEAQPTSLKFNFFNAAVRPAEKYNLLFQRLNPFVLSKVTLTNFCNKNPFVTAKLFQMTLNCVMEVLDLPENSLRAFLLNDETTLELDKAEDLLHADDATDNFKITFKFGFKLRDLLGLEQEEIVWRLSPRRPGEIRLTQAEVPEAAEVCDKVAREMLEDFYNQESTHPTIREWKKQYEERKRNRAAVAGNTEFDVGGDEFEFDIEGRQLPENNDNDDDDEDDFELVQVPNPLPRPPNFFTVANSVRPHICTPPNVFPEYFTLILREGEPLDYVTSVRGHGSILGIVRKMKPSIVANTCVIKNVQTLKSLSLEFVDVSLNTIKVPLNAPSVWIKLDLKCRSGQQY